jgi:hypothetical protein
VEKIKNLALIKKLRIGGKKGPRRGQKDKKEESCSLNQEKKDKVM